MENKEEALSKRLMEVEYIRRELESYISTINTLETTQNSLSESLFGLEELKHGEKEIMVPYTPDIFFKGVINDFSSGIVDIGSNIFKQMDIKDIRKKLESDIKEVNADLNQALQMVQQLQKEGIKLEQEANKLYEEYNSSKNQI